MLLHKNDQKIGPAGVDGLCQRHEFVPAELLCGCGRLLGTITLPPHCEIAEHTHHNEIEVFYALSGNGIYNDNGTEVPLKAGDVAYCPDGGTHALKNNTEEDFVIVAFIGFPSK